MAKKVHSPKSRRVESTPRLLQPEITFRRFWVPRAAMREVPKVEIPEGEKSPERFPLELGIAVKVLVSDEKVGRVLLKLSVKGDPRTKPYQVEVELVGEFVARDSTREAVAEFCRDAGPTLLFPYARQIIDRMTSDGFYGPIRLDPIYLRQMLVEQGWQGDALSPDVSTT
jgi:preprotein translocase subunit SecB